MKTLRAHQTAAIRVAEQIANGTVSERVISAIVTPGGGKTLLGSLFAHRLLENRIIERVCWICPRTSLTEQIADGFHSPDEGCVFNVREANNTPPLVRNEDRGGRGYTTTYQAVAANNDVHKQEFSRFRYLLILDEPHHLADVDLRAWKMAIDPLVAQARVVLAMSGTMERHDGKKIPYIPYSATAPFVPITDSPHIFYSRRAGLAEEAVLPISFIYQNGWSKYLDEDGEHKIEIRNASEEEVRKVIGTFLGRTEYRNEIVRHGIEAWLEFRTNVYSSRAIVISATQPMARDIAKFISSEYPVDVALAISDEPSCRTVLSNFRKKGIGEVLVTCQMAYEGFDAPDCSHLICLTGTRSGPWLEQAFARVTRPDPKSGLKYADQGAFAFVPDDPLMREVCERICAEQPRGILPRDPRGPGPGGPGGPHDRTYFPIGAEASDRAFGIDEVRLEDQVNEWIQSAQQVVPKTKCLSNTDWLRLYQTRPSSSERSDQDEANHTRHEKDLRDKCEELARKIDARRGWKPGTANDIIKRKYRKGRPEMGITELQRCAKDLMILWANDGLPTVL